MGSAIADARVLVRFFWTLKGWNSRYESDSPREGRVRSFTASRRLNGEAV